MWVFLFPVTASHELIGIGRCSEMDIALDFWIHAIYNDEQVREPILSQWSISEATPETS